jgi:hypothetical protein
MIYYEDLLTAKYKPHGRGEDGCYDCYGIVIECCRRAGKTLLDPFKKYEHLSVGAELPYISDYNNIREINAPKTGAVAECKTGENLHVAYMVTPTLALHITAKGCRVTHIRALNPIRFYEVTK